MISEPQKGLARSFSCGTCANLCGHANILPDSAATFAIAATGDLGGVVFQQCLATCGRQCGGTLQGPADELPTWSSGDNSIATLDSGLNSDTATFLGVGPGSTFGNVSATDEGCTARGSGPIKVLMCPTSSSQSALDAYCVELLFPQIDTGIGAISTITVSPATPNNAPIYESFTTKSAGCPASWGNICSGKSTPFYVGQGGQGGIDVNGQQVLFGPVYPGQANTFYDQHALTSMSSLLDASNINNGVHTDVLVRRHTNQHLHDNLQVHSGRNQWHPCNKHAGVKAVTVYKH